MVPLIILGAPRSGTNMLRDCLATLPDMATWPCDEVNYLWRYGNARYPADDLPASLARPVVRTYIRRQFSWVAKRYGVSTVIEKTCANCLRVPFVDAVVPEARYLLIRRDGLDVVGSAMQRWTADLDVGYLMAKARFVPMLDIPYYAARYAWSRIYRLFSHQERVAFWGPRWLGLEAALRSHYLDEVCALQWQRCVDAVDEALIGIDPDRLTECRYEDFIADPAGELSRMLRELDINVDHGAVTHAVSGVRTGSVGKGRKGLSDDATERLCALVGPTLRRYGYY